MMAAVVVGLQQLTTVTELEALPRLLALVSAGAAVYAGFLLVACRAEIEALIETVKT